VFAVTDVVALGALRGLAERGLRAPQDVQVIGFDNITEAAYSTPALTTVDPNKRDIARTALALLDERLNPDTAEIAPREITVDASLVVRESTLP
jgi:DNA-binding LacI/PurR family transcriptional regulator